MRTKRKNTLTIAVVGGLLVLIIFVLGTVWMTFEAKNDTDAAVRSVSLLYLDELAGRREQVVASNLRQSIDDINMAVNLMTAEDLSDAEHLQAYQARIKQLFHMEKFAFVKADGWLYTSSGPLRDENSTRFDYVSLTEPQIGISNPDSTDKKVCFAVPLKGIDYHGIEFIACFAEIDMDKMLEGVSMHSESTDTTFCNIYTADGIALSNTVLGGLAVEDNLLEAMKRARFEKGYSYENLTADFAEGRRGVASFNYDGIRETLSYAPVQGTNWMLTYLIRESVISENISAISNRMIGRSVVQSLLMVAALVAMFLFILSQTRKNAKLLLEKETSEAESRVKQEELEHRLSLQDQLLQEKQRGEQLEKMMTALAADYWSVYYLELDEDRGVCYQSHADLEDGFRVGDHFPYLASVTAYANRYVAKPYLEDFLQFIQPDAIRQGLQKEPVISYRYKVARHGKESYEMVRFARVPDTEHPDDHRIHNVGACFTDVDEETRQSLAKNQALRDALTAAEEANRAKTAFLSNMSHEIRTPMNAIIGLDNIALNDPETPEKTKAYLEKIDASAEHLLNLINDILDMSRIESGRLVLKNEEFSFSRLLETINTMFSGQCQEKGLDYQCHINGEVDDYYIGDNMKLRQVLINILGNAVKFTPEGGKVSLTVERTGQFGGKSALCFTIADTGVGMSKDFLPHLFDSFTQEDTSVSNRFGSTGLGMAITKNIVELMNGHIDVQSEKGVGTTFAVTVTLMDTDRVDTGDDEEIQPHEMSVLIVDDDPVACEHAKLVLEKAGISSETVSSGAEALELVKLRQARMDPYNLILIDWKMPDMDGVETTRQIRSIVGHDSAIIILTAYRWDDVLEEAIQAGVDSFLPKPLFAKTVMDEFRDALKRKTRASGKKKPKADLTGRRILLAEDMEINAEIIITVLQMHGMEADLAENGRIALDKFSSHPEGYYDAVLMDMRMPVMGGLEATRAIRALPRDDAKKIPIIALTANAFDEDVEKSMMAGLNAHLSKPLQPDLLFETLENLIPE